MPEPSTCEALVCRIGDREMTFDAIFAAGYLSRRLDTDARQVASHQDSPPGRALSKCFSVTYCRNVTHAGIVTAPSWLARRLRYTWGDREWSRTFPNRRSLSRRDCHVTQKGGGSPSA